MRFPQALPAILLAAAGSAAAGCVSTSDIDALHTQIASVQRQVGEMQTQAPSKQDVGNLEGRIGKQMESLLKTEADMQVKLQNLSSHIDELQAKLEETNNRLAQLSQQIAATNQDLQNFRSVAPSGNEPADGAVANPAPTTTPPLPPGVGVPAGLARPGAKADPKTLYDSSYNDYLKGNYDLAMREFQEYIDEYPNTDLTDNATYWVGECYYRQRKFRQAITQFDQVLNRFPRSDKTASALLKKGYAYLELNERSQGVNLLRQVLRQHGTSDEANLARQRLRELGVDGRP